MQMTEIMSEISSIESVLLLSSRTRKTSAIPELSDDEIISIEKCEKDVIYKNDQAVKTVKNTKQQRVKVCSCHDDILNALKSSLNTA